MQGKIGLAHLNGQRGINLDHVKAWSYNEESAKLTLVFGPEEHEIVRYEGENAKALLSLIVGHSHDVMRYYSYMQQVDQEIKERKEKENGLL